MSLLCPDCRMLFNSAELLSKHRTRFCLGGNVAIEPRTGRRNSPELILRGQPPPMFTSPARSGVVSPPSTLSSMSIRLSSSSDEDDAPIMTAGHENRQRNLRQQADQHGRNLAQYKTKSKELAYQKHEIDRRLKQIGTDPFTGSTVETTQSLQQLQAQEARNIRALADLKKQVHGMSHIRPISSNSSLLAEIKTLRQLYIQQGGAHSQILAQIAELEAEAKLLDGSDRLPARPKAKYDTVNEQLVAFEVENHRLQQELLETQERNNQLLAKRTKGNDDDGEADRLRRKQDMYRKRLDDMEEELELLKRQTRLAAIQREVIVDREHPTPVHAVPPPHDPPPIHERPADVPPLIHSQPNSYVDTDRIPNGPYDRHAGMMVFYDFATGLDLGLQAARLVVSLYNNTAQYGQPSVLPTVYCDGGTTGFDSQRGAVYNSALIGAKQPVPRCPPAPDLGLVVELQVAGAGGRLSTRGWCRLNLFDHGEHLLCGRWRVPIKILPIQPDASMSEFYSIPQYGAAELFLRVVNYRDADAQSMAVVGIQNAPRYQDPPQAHTSRPNNYIPPPPSASPPDSPASYAQSETHRYDYDHQDMFTIGFQVYNVKNAEHGEGKVRITAYHKSTGKVVQSETSPVTANTTSVSSTFRYKHHMFGQQEATFTNVDLHPDIILVLRFYLRKSLTEDFSAMVIGLKQNGGINDDEHLVAWTTMPLLTPRGGKASRSSDLSDFRIRSGTHSLPLYYPPVPEPETVPLHSPKHWQQYNGGASVKFHVFVSKPRPGSMSPSDDSEREGDSLPQYSWLQSPKPRSLTEPYNATDGIDVYVDGCRFLPDAVTYTRVAGRVLSRSYEKVGKDINTNVSLDSDIYNPVYEYRSEIREPSLPPTATLLLKVYTVDRFSKYLTVIGYSTLNVFVVLGTNQQPSSDTAGIQVALNEGAHQLRLYQLGPNGQEPLSSQILAQSGTRHIPCATILVRLHKAAIGPQGRLLEAERVPQTDWVRLGLYEPRPTYDSGVYQSLSCKPTLGERKLYRSLVKRTKISLRESLRMTLEPSEMRKLKTDKHTEQYIRSHLTRLMDVTPNDFDLTFIAQYNPKLGMKFSLDGAVNIPWSNYTHGHFCLNPPAAFYQGYPLAAYDTLTFTNTLDPESSNKNPVWKDGFRSFPSRSYHRHLTMIIHLQEVQVTVTADSYKYGLMDQAWTAVPMFSEDYAHTDYYRVPLFLGSPSTYNLKMLSSQPFGECVQQGVANGNIKLIPGASVIVRVADARRDDELPSRTLDDQQLSYNTSLLPHDRKADYVAGNLGRTLSVMVPQGRSPQEFFQGLANKFKSLVYKLYEEGNLNAK